MRTGIRFVAGLAIVALLGMAVGTAAEEKAKHLDPHGEPAGFKAGSGDAYAVWHGKHGWHLRTTTAKKRHHFKGFVKVEDGHFT